MNDEQQVGQDDGMIELADCEFERCPNFGNPVDGCPDRIWEFDTKAQAETFMQWLADNER
jgi:hypothetical protein